MIRSDKFTWRHGQNKADMFTGALSVGRLPNSSRSSVGGVESSPVVLV